MPQAKLTLNLLQQANADPQLSVYAYLHSPFVFNKMPLAPMGCHVQVHKSPATKEVGLTIQLMDSIYIHRPNIIEPTIATSS